MCNKIGIVLQSKINISAGDDLQSIEIGSSAIDNGLLKQFPDSTLAITLYLITHLEKGGYVQTNPVIISSYLPDSYPLELIKEGLNYLAAHNIIKVYPRRDGDYTYRIKVNLNALSDSYHPQNSTQNLREEDEFEQHELRQQIMRRNSISREELTQALVTFIPSAKNTALARDEINHWLDDFDFKMLQELIRRVDKWINNHANPPQKAFNYLQGIIDDWYRKEIFTYERLKHFDKLYRETKELASTYGIKGWQNVNPIHMETFKRWLTDDFPLSISVAKYAIKEAIKRKRDSQPSLKYIEDNFIIPWKKAEIKNIEEAKDLLNQKFETKQKSNNKTKSKKKNKKTRWGSFYRSFEDYRET